MKFIRSFIVSFYQTIYSSVSSQHGDSKPPSTPPHISASMYPMSSYFGQYDNPHVLHPYFRSQAPGVSMAVPISSGYSSSMGMPSALSASPYSSMHNKHPGMSTGYYPSPNTMLRPGQSHSQTYISSPWALHQPNLTWSTGHMKPSVVVSKRSIPTSIVPPAGITSNGTATRPPSRDQPAAPPATSSSSATKQPSPVLRRRNEHEICNSVRYLNSGDPGRLIQTI